MIRLIQDRVSERADRRPEARAVVDPDGHASYGELEVRANRIAHLLRDAGCRRGDRVAFLLPRDRGAVAAVLGILKAGGIYVPLSPGDPPARSARVLASAEPRVLLLGGGASPDALEELGGAGSGEGPEPRVGWLDAGEPSVPEPAFTLADVERAPETPPEVEGRDPSDPAYLMFTSGSTGTPKGVLVAHRNVTAFVEWAVEHFGLGPGSRLSGHSALTFDLSTKDLYATFASGGELHFVPGEVNLLPHRLVEFMAERGLTHWLSVPSVLELVARFDALPPGGLPALRTLSWCGEVLPVPVLRYWMERLPHVAFTNLYGPTETTVASTVYAVPRPLPPELEDLPIGVPCRGEEVLVLDETLRPAKPGEKGWIYIRGAGVGPGYWRDEEATRAAFLPDPFSDDPDARLYRTGDLGRVDDEGLVHFLGREDHQIKTRGYRVEPGEVESALHRLPEIALAVVVGLRTGGFEGTVPACAYVPAAGGASLTPGHLRRRLEEFLPRHMIPARWLEVERLPTNPRGKVDRARVAELFRGPDVGRERARAGREEES